MGILFMLVSSLMLGKISEINLFAKFLFIKGNNIFGDFTFSSLTSVEQMIFTFTIESNFCIKLLVKYNASIFSFGIEKSVIFNFFFFSMYSLVLSEDNLNPPYCKYVFKIPYRIDNIISKKTLRIIVIGEDFTNEIKLSIYFSKDKN